MTPEERAERKAKIRAAQMIKDGMTVEEKINFVNTPYSELPEELQAGMTKRPQKFNFIRMNKPHIGFQRETFAARLIRYRDKYHLTPERFCDIANEYGKSFGTKITVRDISNYENFNVCPKIDKLTLISKAMDVSLDYLTGYGPDNRKMKKPA